MADSIKFNELFDPNFQSEFKKFLSTIKKLNESFESSIKEIKTNVNSLKTDLKNVQVGDSDSAKRLAEMQKQLEAYEAKLKSLNGQLKKNKQTETELEKAKKKLSNATRSEAKEIALLNEKTRRARKELRDNAKATLDGSNAYEKLKRSTNKAQLEFKRLASELGLTDKKTIAARREFEKLDDRLRKVNNAARDGRRDVGRYHLAMGNLRATLSSGLGALGVTGGIAGLAMAARNSVGIFVSFEKSLSNLEAVSGATADELSRMSVQAKELGATTAFTASQVVELQTEFAKLGFPTQEIEQMTESTLNAAAAMGSSLGETAALTGATLKAFGLDASEAARVNDVLAKSTSSSALDFSKLNAAMSTVAPVAKSFGFSVEATTALLGELSDAGFDASTAATSTRNILLNLADANGSLAKELGEPVKDLPSLVKGLKKLDSEGIKLAKTLELTDRRSVAAFNTFLEGADNVLALNEKLEQAGGTAKKMADTQLDNLDGAVTKLNSAWQGFILSLEEGNGIFAKILRNIVESTSAFLGYFTATDRTKKSIIELGRETTNFVSSSRELVGVYTDLSEKTNLTADEKERLNVVTGDLIDRFGDSIVEIDKETGAFRLNTEEIIRQIQLKAALNSQTVQDLLVEKQRLQVLKDQAEAAKKQFESLQSSLQKGAGITGFDEELSNYIKGLKRLQGESMSLSVAFGKGLFGDAQAILDSLPISTQKTLERINELFKKSESGIGIDFSIEEIEDQLATLGIDLKEIAEISKEGFDNISKGGEESLGVLGKLKKQISDLREEQDKTDSKKRVGEIEREIQVLEDKIKMLRGVEAAVKSLSKEEQKRVKELFNSLDDMLDESKEFNEEFISDQKEALDNYKKFLTSTFDFLKENQLGLLSVKPDFSFFDEYTQRIELLQKALNDGLITQADFQESVKRVNRELAADIVNEPVVQGAFDALQQRFANVGQELQGLQTQFAEAETQAQREDIAGQIDRLQRLQKAEYAAAVIQAFRNALERGEPISKALGDAGQAVAVQALANQFAGFKEGGYTGDVGTSDVAGVTHGKEYVIRAKETNELGLRGVRPDKLMEHLQNRITDYSPLINMADSANASLASIPSLGIDEDSLSKKIGDNVAKKIPGIDLRMVGGHLNYVISKNGSTKRTIFKNKNRAL